MVARDVVELTDWYVGTFGCVVVTPPTALDDPVLCRAIGVPEGTIVTLSMLSPPGQEADGAIIEFYSLNPTPEDWPYRAGQGQVAFQVDDVDGVAERFIAGGGALHGDAVDWVAPSGRTSRFVYTRDPEGNLVDLYGV